MCTPAYVDSKTITQVDGAQGSRVPVPLPDDPYVAVRQAQLVDTDLELEEAPSEAEELQSLGSRVPLMGEEFEAFESLWGELGEEDTKEDEISNADDKKKTVSEPLGLRYGAARHHVLESIEEITPSTYEVRQSSRSIPEQEGVERIYAFRQPTLVTWVNPEDDRVYTDVLAYAPPAAPVQTPPSPEWSFDEDQFIGVGAQLELHGSILHDHTQLLDALSPTLFADIDRDVRELYTRSRMVRYEIFSQRYRFRSLEREQERTVVTFGALWRPMLALEAWAGRVDTRFADMSWDRYDDHILIHDMLVQQAAMQRKLQEMRGRVAALK
ncbi:hypothetical protein Tco_1501762 [Tanacetum coccineum]